MPRVQFLWLLSSGLGGGAVGELVSHRVLHRLFPSLALQLRDKEEKQMLRCFQNFTENFIHR